MKMDIRLKTCIIIRKGNEFLVGRIFASTDLRWSLYAHEAWQTRDRTAAEKVAEKVGGEMVLFNPIVRQMKTIGA